MSKVKMSEKKILQELETLDLKAIKKFFENKRLAYCGFESHMPRILSGPQTEENLFIRDRENNEERLQISRDIFADGNELTTISMPTKLSNSSSTVWSPVAMLGKVTMVRFVRGLKIFGRYDYYVELVDSAGVRTHIYKDCGPVYSPAYIVSSK